MSYLQHLPELRSSSAKAKFVAQIKEAVVGLEEHGVLDEVERPDGTSWLDLVAASHGQQSVLRLCWFEGKKGITIRIMDAGSSQLSTEEYYAAVRSLVAPILASCRSRFGESFHWLRPPRRRLSPGAQRIIEALKETVSGEAFDDIDWVHFYQFIVYCHDYRIRMDSTGLEQTLRDIGFDENLAKTLARAYRHGRKVLERQKDARDERAWARVIARGEAFDA